MIYVVRQAMTERNMSVAQRGEGDEKIVKLLVVRRRNKLTGELYIDRFYLTFPFKEGLSLVEKGYVVFKLEVQGDGKITLTPLTSPQP